MRLIRAFHLPAALSQLTPLCFDEGGRAGPADTGSSPRAIAASAFAGCLVLSVRDMALKTLLPTLTYETVLTACHNSLDVVCRWRYQLSHRLNKYGQTFP